MKTKREEKSSIVNKVTIEEKDDWYAKKVKKTLYTSLFSLFLSIVVIVIIFYKS
ncbi:hypothetical protein [Bacillus wiedmannii]|uniref:hypothetical protein n=1 Tax=Bacillus wiedmannii TaxID=1890302 RepID=UPI0015D50715|nr:hypothetical protein [Bacillus wiedmannii]